MACNCSKRKQPTGFGVTLPQPRVAPTADKPAEVYRIQKPDGTVTEFGSKMEAHAERLRNGGKFI